MAEVAGLKIAIGASVEDFKAGLADVKSSLGGLGDFASSALGLLTNPIALATAAVVGIGAAAFKVGSDFEQAFGTIRVGTGATGQQLEGLKESFRTVFASVPGDAAAVGTAIADVNTKFGATGPVLEGLSGQFLQLAKITGTDVAQNVDLSSKAMKAWGVDAEDAASKNDFLFKTSQALGPSFSEITGLVTQQAPALKELGFSFEQSAVLAAKLQAETGNASGVLSSLSRALKEAADDGVPANEAFANIVESIKSAKDPAEASKIAFDNFGKQGLAMAEAIQNGRFEIDDLVASLENSTETIGSAEEESRTFQDRLDLVWKSVQSLLAPIGELLVGALNAVLDLFIALSPAIDFVAKAIGKVVDFIKGAVTLAFRGFINLLDEQIKVLEKIPFVGDKVAGAFRSVRDGLANAIKPTKDATEAIDASHAALTKVGEPSSGSAPRAAAAVRDVGKAHEESTPKIERYTDAQNLAVEAANRLKEGEDAVAAQAGALGTALNSVPLPTIKGQFDGVNDSVLDVTNSMANADVQGSLDQWKSDAEQKLPEVKGAFETWGEGVKSITDSLSKDMVTGLFTGDLSFGGSVGEKLNAIKDSFVDVFQTKIMNVLTGPDGFVTKGINAVTGALDGLISKLTGSGGVQSAFGQAFNLGGGGAVPGVSGGVPGVPGVPGGGGVGAAAGSTLSAVTVVVTAVSGVVSAVSGIIFGIQAEKDADNQNELLLQIKNVLYDSIAETGYFIATELQFGNIVKAVEDFRNKFWDVAVPSLQAVEAHGAYVQPTLDHFGAEYFSNWGPKFDEIARNTAATEQAVRQLQSVQASQGMRIDQIQTAIERNEGGITTTLNKYVRPR